jgi:hypothetical protein
MPAAPAVAPFEPSSVPIPAGGSSYVASAPAFEMPKSPKPAKTAKSAAPIGAPSSDSLGMGKVAKASPRAKSTGAYEREPRDSWESRAPRESRESRPSREAGSAVGRLWIGAGADAGIRPGDLVGAIANEAGLSSKSIGAVRISERYSTVEVPAELVAELVDVLRGATLKGRKFVIRPDRDQASSELEKTPYRAAPSRRPAGPSAPTRPARPERPSRPTRPGGRTPR